MGRASGRLALSLLGALTLAGSAGAQGLDETCTASLLNRATQVDVAGLFTLPDVPAEPGPLRVRVVCEEPGGGVRRGHSGYLELARRGVTPVGEIEFEQLEPIPVRIEVTTPEDMFMAPGESAQLTATAFFADGSSGDVTPRAAGTHWSTSSSRIAGVSADGRVVALATGTAILQARHQGVLGSVRIQVTIGRDRDGDGLPDDYERVRTCLNPDVDDRGLDPDTDGLTNEQELAAGTEPCVRDTDSDGLDDGDPADPDPLNPDFDGDGLVDGEEAPLRFVPTNRDTDGDGLPDGFEAECPGFDCLPDGDEDDDHLSNLDEITIHFTDPRDSDTDGGGRGDGEEVLDRGTDPLDPGDDFVVGILCGDMQIVAADDALRAFLESANPSEDPLGFQTATFLRAITRVLRPAFEQAPGSDPARIDSISELLDALGVDAARRDPFQWSADLLVDQDGRCVQPEGLREEDVERVLRREFLEHLGEAITALETIPGDWQGSCNLGDVVPIEIDQADALLLRSFYHAVRGVILLLDAYDFDVDLEEACRVFNESLPPAPSCEDETRTIRAGGPGTQACRQFDGDATSCETAWHVSRTGFAAGCFYFEGLCRGCGPENERNGECTNTCGEPNCADPTRTIAAGGPGTQGCRQFDGDAASCEVAWHLSGFGGPAACFFFDGVCLGCGPSNEFGSSCTNTCEPTGIVLPTVETLLVQLPQLGTLRSVGAAFAAGQELAAAVDRFRDGLDAIQAETDSQLDDLFSIDPGRFTPEREARLRDGIARLRASFLGPEAAPELRICGESSLDLGRFFTGVDLRQNLPPFVGNAPSVDALPDPTLGGTLPATTIEDLRCTLDSRGPELQVNPGVSDPFGSVSGLSPFHLVLRFVDPPLGGSPGHSVDASSIRILQTVFPIGSGSCGITVNGAPVEDGPDPVDVALLFGATSELDGALTLEAEVAVTGDAQRGCFIDLFASAADTVGNLGDAGFFSIELISAGVFAEFDPPGSPPPGVVSPFDFSVRLSAPFGDVDVATRDVSLFADPSCQVRVNGFEVPDLFGGGVVTPFLEAADEPDGSRTLSGVMSVESDCFVHLCVDILPGLISQDCVGYRVFR